MATPYIGEVRMFAGSFAPAGWAFCDGQLLSIAENETLFIVLGTSYGGDGETTFAVPDLRGRVPLHRGPIHPLAESGGVESTTITIPQMPSHRHVFHTFDSVANTPNPGNNMFGLSSQVSMFFGDNPGVNMGSGAMTSVGGSQPHENMMPYVCVSFIISLYGLFPSET